MTNETKQTAVDYYINATMALEVARGMNNINIKEYIARKKLIIDKAKEMEKEQIKDAYNDAAIDATYGEKYKNFEQYYNETYGGNK